MLNVIWLKARSTKRFGGCHQRSSDPNDISWIDTIWGFPTTHFDPNVRCWYERLLWELSDSLFLKKSVSTSQFPFVFVCQHPKTSKKTHAKRNIISKNHQTHTFLRHPKPKQKTQKFGAFFSLVSFPCFFLGEGGTWEGTVKIPSVDPHLYLPTGNRQVIFVIIGFTWATGASVNFMSELLPEDRKAGGGGWFGGLGWVGDGPFWRCWGKILGWRWTQIPSFFLFVVCLGILFSCC